jgi:hypothetical protein
MEDFAVIVGINTYPGLNTLSGPENDARAFRDWVVAPLGGNVPDANLHLICSSDYVGQADPVRPLKTDIYAAFNRLRALAKANGGKVGRRLYMFYAGHGIGPDNEPDESALLMANAESGSLSHVPGVTVTKHFQAASFFDQLVLFMDCCRDSWANTRLQRPDWDPEPGLDPDKVQRVLGFGGKWDHKAREREFELEPGKKQVHGVFTAHLLTLLRAGKMSAPHLRTQLLNSKTRFAGAGAPYDPDIKAEDGPGIVFGEAAADARFPVTFKFRDELAAGEQFRIVNGTDMSVVHQSSPAGRQFTFELLPGLYGASIAATARGTMFTVPGEAPHEF